MLDSYIFWYFMIGVIFMFLLEVLSHVFYDHIVAIDPDEVPSYDWFTRIFTIVLWPVQLVYILHAFIKGEI